MKIEVFVAVQYRVMHDNIVKQGGKTSTEIIPNDVVSWFCFPNNARSLLGNVSVVTANVKWSFTLNQQIEIDARDFFENVLRILRHVVKEEVKRLNETVNRHQWGTTPAIVNAYYSRSKNQISKRNSIINTHYTLLSNEVTTSLSIGF